MKYLLYPILIATFVLLGTSCVSRTTTAEKAYGRDSETKEVIWIWQKEYRNKG